MIEMVKLMTPTDKPLRWVGWQAVSSEEQVRSRRMSDGLTEEEKISLRFQGEENRKLAAKHGGQLLCELVVDGDSRDIVLLEDARSQVEGYIQYPTGAQVRCHPYAEIYRLIKERAFDVLVYLDLGRLGRDMVLSQAIIRLCHRAGIITCSTKSPPASLDRPQMSQQDYLLHAIGAVSYQEELAEIKRRNTIGMVSRIERGDFAYAVPFPWVEKREGKRRWVDLDERGAEAIRLAVDLYLNHGRSAAAIAEELNARGYRLPKNKPWYARRIELLIEEIRRYAGWTEVNRNSKTGRPYQRARLRWPAIITDEQAQAVEDEHYRRYEGRGSVYGAHRFSQCVFCAQCGTRMNANYWQDTYKDKQYTYERYVCTTQHPRRHIQAWRIEEAVAAHLDWWSRTEDIAAALPALTDRTATLQAEQMRLDADLVRHRERLDRVDDAFADGAMTLDGYRRQAERIKVDIAATQADIDALHKVMLAEARNGNRQERIEELVAHGAAMLVEEDLAKANAFFRRLVRVYVENGRVVRVETP